jgi:hypothetical protein
MYYNYLYYQINTFYCGYRDCRHFTRFCYNDDSRCSYDYIFLEIKTATNFRIYRCGYNNWTSYSPFNLISNTDVLNLFSEIGIILLLFTVGMEFPIQKLRNIGKRATIITVIEQIGTLIVGYFVGRGLEFSFYNSLFMAVALSVSSTVIIIKILEE